MLVPLECLIVGDETTCNCSAGYIWSNEVCYSFSCCRETICSRNVSLITPLCVAKTKGESTDARQCLYLYPSSPLNEISVSHLKMFLQTIPLLVCVCLLHFSLHLDLHYINCICLLLSELKLIVTFAINTVDINGTITGVTWDSSKQNMVNITLATNV